MENTKTNFDLLFMESLMRLESGCLLPLDREILSSAPLPSNITDHYTAKDIRDVNESMNLTFNAMVVWVEQAKKVNYFSPHFVRLSKLIMQGVTLMGRGLITLHARGQDLSTAPMSIDDLISVASYHLRKSYLGVLQTAVSRPEVSERLLINQIGWNNMLMRLFRTREKLSQPVTVISTPVLEETLPEADPAPAAALPSSQVSPAIPAGKSADRAISESKAIGEPGAFSAPRAFSSYDRTKSTGSRRCKTAVLPSAAGNEENKNVPQEIGEPGKKESTAVEPENVSPERKCGTAEDESCLPETGCMKKEPETAPVPEEKTGISDQPEKQEKQTDHGLPEKDSPDELPEEKNIPDDPDKVQQEKQPEGEPKEDPPDESWKHGLPGYLSVLQNVYARSGPTTDGGLLFTMDEIRYLADDPDFNKFYTETAREMKKILESAAGGSDPGG